MDADEKWAWFRVGKQEAARHLPEGTEIKEDFGPRKMRAGPAGIAGMNLNTGEIKYAVSVSFQIGHIQSNSWKAGEIIFCWKTGGKSPQQTWIVNSDGTGLWLLYPESKYEWVTHDAVIGRDEVAIAIMGHRATPNASLENLKESTGVYGANPGQETEWGPCGAREKPTGHVSSSSDGRFATGDDFDRNLYLIDRKSREMILLSAGHKKSSKKSCSSHI